MANVSSTAIKYALQVQEKYDVPASVVLAAYGQESGWGSSYLATNHNNYFGMSGSGTAGTYVSSTGRKWASYNSMEESFDAFGKLLSGEKYSALTKGTTNAAEYVRAYGETYAPASDNNGQVYADKITRIIEQNNFTQYDKVFEKWKFADEGIVLPESDEVIYVDSVVDKVEKPWWDFFGITDNATELALKIAVAVCLILLVVGGLFFLAKTFGAKLPTKENLVGKVLEEVTESE